MENDVEEEKIEEKVRVREYLRQGQWLQWLLHTQPTKFCKQAGSTPVYITVPNLSLTEVKS